MGILLFNFVVGESHFSILIWSLLSARPSSVITFVATSRPPKMAIGHLKEGPSQQTVDFDCRVFSGDIPEHMSILFRTVADHEKYSINTMLRCSVASQLLRFFTSVISRSFIILFCSILFFVYMYAQLFPKLLHLYL